MPGIMIATVAIRLPIDLLPAAWFGLDTAGRRAHSIGVDDTDTRDIYAALSGDGEAYASIIRRYQGRIAKRMWRFTRDQRQLEELVHDVFVEAYLGLKGFRHEAPLEHWLNRIATRVGYRFWKRRKREASRTISLQDWDGVMEVKGDGEIEAVEAGELLHHLLAQLPPRDRLVLTLRYLEDMSVEEAAENTGWSGAMVKVQTHRARKKLRALLEKTEESKQWERLELRK